MHGSVLPTIGAVSTKNCPLREGQFQCALAVLAVSYQLSAIRFWIADG
jgi:hypothetical protein